MPKKTKKAKLLAEAHRRPTFGRHPSSSHSQLVQQSIPIEPSGLSYRLQTITHKEHAKITALTVEHSAIRHDLIKTVVWSTLIIISELLLSRYIK